MMARQNAFVAVAAPQVLQRPDLTCPTDDVERIDHERRVDSNWQHEFLKRRGFSTGPGGTRVGQCHLAHMQRLQPGGTVPQSGPIPCEINVFERKRERSRRFIRLRIPQAVDQFADVPAASLALDETVTQVWNEWRATEPVRRQAMVALQAPGVQVEFDTEHLRRVLINLLDNALRFMGSQPDSLQLHTHAAGTGLVSLQVWSDGAPLDPSVERHLFEPFFSSHSRSSGLGLYICRELCQRHGASLTYQRLSRATALGPTGGNAFTVTFRKTTRPAEPAGLFDTLLV